MQVEHWDAKSKRTLVLHEDVRWTNPPSDEDPHTQLKYWTERYEDFAKRLSHRSQKQKGNDALMLERDKAMVQRNKFRGITRDLMTRAHLMTQAHHITQKEPHIEAKEG